MPAERDGPNSLASKGAMPFRVVQPWGKDRGREATVLSEHRTREEALAEIDRLNERMRATGVAPGALDLLVVDSLGNIVAQV